MAIYFAGQYLLGGAIGPVIVGWLSDSFARSAMLAAGSLEMTEQLKAVGLHGALYRVPVTLFLTGIFILVASRTYQQDHQRMVREMSDPESSSA